MTSHKPMTKEPTREHPGVLFFDGKVIVYWLGRPTKKVVRASDGVPVDVPVPGSTPGWCAVEQGKPGAIEVTPAMRAAIEEDQRLHREKE